MGKRYQREAIGRNNVVAARGGEIVEIGMVWNPEDMDL